MRSRIISVPSTTSPSPLKSREGSNVSANVTDLFTSRDVTNIDVSLNVSEFDKRFRDIATKLNSFGLGNLPEFSPQTEGENSDEANKTVFSDQLSFNRTHTGDNETLDLSTTFITVDAGKSANQSYHEDLSRVTYITQDTTGISERNISINNQSNVSDQVDYPRIESVPSVKRVLQLQKLPEALSTPHLTLSLSHNSSATSSAEDPDEPKPPPRRSPRLRQCSDPLIRPRKLNSSSDLESVSNVLDISELTSCELTYQRADVSMYGSESTLSHHRIAPACTSSSSSEALHPDTTPPKPVTPRGTVVNTVQCIVYCV